jgi:hypothetical protein
MNAVKWIVLFCIAALACAFFCATHLKGGIEGGQPSGKNGDASGLPRHQKKVTSVYYWEVGTKSNEQGGVSSNPFTE